MCSYDLVPGLRSHLSEVPTPTNDYSVSTNSPLVRKIGSQNQIVRKIRVTYECLGMPVQAAVSTLRQITTTTQENGVATISTLLKIKGLFYIISSLL